MKSIEYIINKYSYNDANPNGWMPENNSFFQEDPYPFNQYYPPGEIVDRDDYNERQSNHQRDGKDFEEFNQFKRKNRIKRLKRLRKLLKLKNMKKKKNVFQPHPFFSSPYGYTGFEGTTTSPLEYYSGSIMDEPGSITNNPYNDTYQGNSFANANSRSERIRLRGMIFKEYIIKP